MNLMMTSLDVPWISTVRHPVRLTRVQECYRNGENDLELASRIGALRLERAIGVLYLPAKSHGACDQPI